MKEDERVMCVPASLLPILGIEANAFTPDKDDRLLKLLTPQHVSWQRRGDCEEDPSFKQIIPYMVLLAHTSSEPLVGLYQRTKQSGEKRLHGNWSIGLGGHVNSEDALTPSCADPRACFNRAWHRELHEEVKIDTQYAPNIAGFLYDDSNDVGKVHLGVVMLIRLQFGAVYPNDDEVSRLHFPAWKDVRSMSLHGKEVEQWSRILLRSDEFAALCHEEE